MNRVVVKPELVQWARERAGLDLDDLVARFGKLPEWERGEVSPTFKRLQDFCPSHARAVRLSLSAGTTAGADADTGFPDAEKRACRHD